MKKVKLFESFTSRVNEMSMGYDGNTGLFYIKGVPFTEERLEQVLKHLRTKVKLGNLPKQFSYLPAIQVADKVGGETVTITLDEAEKIAATLKRFKGKLAHDGDFNESVNEAKSISRDDMMDWIGKYMRIAGTSEDFNGSEGGIWVSGEDSDEYKGNLIYSYYSEGKAFELGVNVKWEKELNKRGWYSEWYDAGTIQIWEI